MYILDTILSPTNRGGQQVYSQKAKIDAVKPFTPDSLTLPPLQKTNWLALTATVKG